jgi:hypothetical protein
LISLCVLRVGLLQVTFVGFISGKCCPMWPRVICWRTSKQMCDDLWLLCVWALKSHVKTPIPTALPSNCQFA